MTLIATEMSSLISESPILNVSNPRRYGPSPDSITLRNGTFEIVTVTSNLIVSGSFNGVALSGTLVSTDGTQTLTNKTITAPIITGIITHDANNIERTSSSITTTNNTPTTLVTVATATNNTYYIRITASVADSTGGVNSGTYKYSAKVKNLAGVLTISSTYDVVTALDGTLSTTSIAFNSSGTSVLVQAVGLAATTLKWFAVAKIITQAF